MSEGSFKKTLKKIIVEIKNTLKLEKIMYSYIIDYILGHGNWFELQDEKEKTRGIIIENSSDQELSEIINWCYQKMKKEEYYINDDIELILKKNERSNE